MHRWSHCPLIFRQAGETPTASTFVPLLLGCVTTKPPSSSVNEALVSRRLLVDLNIFATIIIDRSSCRRAVLMYRRQCGTASRPCDGHGKGILHFSSFFSLGLTKMLLLHLKTGKTDVHGVRCSEMQQRRVETVRRVGGERCRYSTT